MRTIIAIAVALGFLVAVSAQTSAQTAAGPTAEQCKTEPKPKGCGKYKPTAEQCKTDPSLKGCNPRQEEEGGSAGANGEVIFCWIAIRVSRAAGPLVRPFRFS
jgi:hypothetical protein